MRPLGVLKLVAMAALLAGCASRGYLEGRDLLAAGRVEEGLAKLEQAVRESPDRIEYRAYLARQRELASSQVIAEADLALAQGRLADAERAYDKALKLDARSARGAEGREAVARVRRQGEVLKEAEQALAKGDLARAEARVQAVLAETPQHGPARALMRRIEDKRGPELPAAGVDSPFARPITLEFRDAPLRGVFETMSRVAGINFVFDRDLRQDLRITIFVRNTSIDEVMRLILSTNGLERKLLSANSVLIYPNTPAKAREHVELAIRTFYLTHADAKLTQTMIRAMAKTRDLYVDEKLNAVIVRDTPEAIRLVEKLIASIDLPEPEVMLEIEVMEIAASRVQEIGVRWPSQAQFGDIGTIRDTLSATTTGGATVTQQSTTFTAPPRLQVNSRGIVGGNAVWSVTNPVAVANLRADISATNTLANPRIRVRNREKAKVHIGDKLPVFTTTSTANVGVSASVSYLDVGLKLDIEPSVALDGEVSMKVALEVSNVAKEIAGPSGSIAYQIGTRLTNTVLRLKDGETQILAGLINDEDRSSANRVPGLGDIPILGRLFGSQTDTRNKTEIVLLITPRVLRNLVPPAMTNANFPAGTEAQAGAQPLRLTMTAPRSLGLSGSGGPGNAAPAPAPAEAAPGAASANAPAPAAVGSAAPPPAGAPAEANAVGLTLAVNGEVRPTRIISASVGLANGTTQRPVQVELSYDANVLVPIGAQAEGPGRLALAIPQGGAGATARFRVIGAAGAVATIGIGVARFADGGDMEYVAPQPVTVTVGQ